MDVTEDTLKSYELEVLDLTNTFRVSKGLQALTWNDQAAEAARLHSEDMAKRSFLTTRILMANRLVIEWLHKG
ncbi:Cysteine-rich secretory protein family protein [compost metagenome]